MPRKRMILEEVEEKNPLVPGTPTNPISLGEKSKAILVHLKLYEDDGRPGHRGNYEYSEYAQAWERLEYLKLIEWREKYNPVQLAVKGKEAAQLRKDACAYLKGYTKSLYDIRQLITTLESLEAEIEKNPRIVVLTQAGRDVLLSGTVTISL